jgi:hypothetical protein
MYIKLCLDYNKYLKRDRTYFGEENTELVLTTQRPIGTLSLTSLTLDIQGLSGPYFSMYREIFTLILLVELKFCNPHAYLAQ